MSKDRKKTIHIHSSVNDKQPTPATLELGELGVNNAKGNAFISTKNSDGEIVRFSEDETLISWMEQKEVFPYEGYVRGSNDSASGVTNSDLLSNKSNIIIKLNQVVPMSTEYDEKVNGKKDIYGNPINPISSDKYRDGAGFAIDMSLYAMNGSNPSFSSMTTTCHATLNGTTEIKGKPDSCGSKFTAEVQNVCIDANETLNEIGIEHSNFGVSCDGSKISKDTTLKGEKILIDSPEGNSSVDIQACGRISGKTNDFIIRECQKNAGNVEIESSAINVSGATTHIKSCDRITLESRNIIMTDGDCGKGEMTIDIDDLCLVGESKANVYGDKTNIGLDCDDSQIATDTRVFGQSTLITTNHTPNKYAVQNNVEVEAAQDIKEKAARNIEEQASANIISLASTDILRTANRNICDTALQKAAFYGKETTSIGSNCGSSETSDTTNIEGKSINIHANEILCESGKSVSIFASDSGKLTIGGNSCSGNTEGTYPIIYVRRPKVGTCELHSTTIDDALDEVYDRSRISLTSTAHTSDTAAQDSSYTEYTIHQDSGSCDTKINFTVNDTIVSMSAETYPASSELLKKYTFWQYIGNQRKEIGIIDIPKDHILKDVSIVNGKMNGETFVPCSTGDNTCSWYIKLVWNVFDPSTGHSDDRVVYLPADSFVKDIDENNSNTDRGVNVDVWYDGQKNQVSATTKITIKNADGTGTKEFSRANGFHTLNSYTLNSVSGDVKTNRNATNWTYDSFDRKVTITAATDASHINRKTVSWRYGDVKNASGNIYDPGDGTVNTFGNSRTMDFVIPQCVNHLNRHMITFKKGSTSTFTNQTYDPGKDCSNTSETINIPTSIDELSNWNGTCINLPHNVCVDGTITSSGSIFSSDRRLKENIRDLTDHDLNVIEKINFKKFNFISDKTKKTTYGIIAQELLNRGLDNIVHVDDEGYYGVDYTSLFILEIANLKREIQRLKNRVSELEDKNQ